MFVMLKTVHFMSFLPECFITFLTVFNYGTNTVKVCHRTQLDVITQRTRKT